MKQRTKLTLDNLVYKLFMLLLLINFFNLLYVVTNFFINKYF